MWAVLNIVAEIQYMFSQWPLIKRSGLMSVSLMIVDEYLCDGVVVVALVGETSDGISCEGV